MNSHVRGQFALRIAPTTDKPQASSVHFKLGDCMSATYAPGGGVTLSSYKSAGEASNPRLAMTSTTSRPERRGACYAPTTILLKDECR